ncbi:hypothetical protein [Nocardia sp. NPDC004123]
MRLETIDRATAKRELERSLALKPELEIDERRYEMLRAVAWASTHAQTPVYVRVLLDRVVSVDKLLNLGDAGISETDRRQILREQLEDLASIGDLAELGNGYWVSVEGVIVELGNDQPCLFVSGVPLRILDQEIRDAITYSGATRHLATGSVPDKLELPKVGLQLWARRQSTDLETWTRQFGKSIRIVASAPTDSLEFYLPETARSGCLQHDRWQRTARNLTGTYLYRQTVLNHWRLHGLADVTAGTVEGTCEIDRQDAHRLMFGYDMLAGNPTTAIWNESASSSAELILHNPVPAPEMRFLTALAKRLPAKKFEHRFIAATYREQVRQTVEDLGIQLVRR